jgi:peptide/nickel transport system permease protein
LEKYKAMSKLRYRFLKNTAVWYGGIILALLSFVAILAPAITPYDPYEYNMVDMLSQPSWTHLAGTDGFGRDIFSRALFGLQLSLKAASLVTLLTGLCGVIIGCIAAYYQKLDNVIMRFMDAMMAFPDIVLALALVAIFKPSLKGVVIALLISYTPRVARIVRGSALQIKTYDFVTAAVAQGARSPRIIFRHILPNVAAEIIVQMTYIFAYAILGEAVLSFLGAGPPPPIPSLGNILSESRDFIFTDWWLSIFPGVVIMLLVLSVNLLGDGLRDVLDPKLS